MNQYDIVIIGGGPAGYTAALYAARGGWRTLVIEKMSIGGQMTLTHMIDNYPGFEEGIEGWQLGDKMQRSAQRFGAETMYATVLSVNLAQPIKTIETDNGFITAKAVILASGADPRPLELANEQALTGRGVHYCAHCDGRFYQNKTVAVVGGGNSAVADALYLSRLANKVYLIHRRDTLRADRIYHDQLNRQENIAFLWNMRVAELLGDSAFEGLHLQDTQNGTIRRLDCDGVFISIGRKPITDYLHGVVALDANGYVIADETTKTNLPGVFAAGDVRQKPLRQVVTAVSDGAVAAHYASEYLMEVE
ncbi:MAG: thioredoxin-disulfide reductase [Clostridia bacterium]|nr:thioredoxin-disulfide reductase [Clostridia bacterium]